jgi:release factor glutamine methyltransferase
LKIRQQLESGTGILASQASAGPIARLEAEILMAHALGTTRSFLYAHSDMEIPAQRLTDFRHLVQRRSRGEPIAYLTGHREFWSLPLAVNEQVLIPRPETELLVEIALEHSGEGLCRIADLGTGCGAIALALASERKNAEVQATDISQAALELATVNARTLGIGNVRFHQGSWCEPLKGRFDLLVSNPPYIAAGDPHLEQGDCRFEPSLALSPGDDGLSAFRDISEQAGDKLRPGGRLLFEHGLDQAGEVRAILAAAGFMDITTRHDLEGRERVTLGRLD